MSAKTSPARRAAFLKALAATGNITVSAERAKVSRSWVLLHRSRDAAFDAACREAVGEARERLREHRERRPASGWGYLSGEELVVKGTNGRRVQIARARLKQWTPRAERVFLERLGETANVKAACAAAGLTPASAYMHRHRWMDFARRWDEVLDETMIRLEGALLERGGNLFSEAEAPIDGPIREMTASEAIYMLEMHKRRVGREAGTPGRRRRPRNFRQEVLPRIMRTMEAFARAEGLPLPPWADPARAGDAEDG
jgi:hypothetical protein